MDPNEIELESIVKLFEYEKISRELDDCNDVNKIRDICKCYVKLYMKQQEVVANLCKISK
jgi:hypothetical protein